MTYRRYSNTEIILELRRQSALRNATWPSVLISDLLPFCDDFETLERQRDELIRTAERAMEAWDTTVLHAPSDGMMQERMEYLREEIANAKES